MATGATPMSKVERVRAALAGGKIDRTPISFWHHFSARDETVEGLVEAHDVLVRQLVVHETLPLLDRLHLARRPATLACSRPSGGTRPAPGARPATTPGGRPGR